VIRQGSATKPETEMQTEQLWMEPDTEVAHTDQPVVIRQKPATVITGTGMRFDNSADTMQLFNRVHVHYERPPVVNRTTSPDQATDTERANKR
jgi:lipopolysaccharide export system protein LptC